MTKEIEKSLEKMYGELLEHFSDIPKFELKCFEDMVCTVLESMTDIKAVEKQYIPFARKKILTIFQNKTKLKLNDAFILKLFIRLITDLNILFESYGISFQQTTNEDQVILEWNYNGSFTFDSSPILDRIRNEALENVHKSEEEEEEEEEGEEQKEKEIPKISHKHKREGKSGKQNKRIKLNILKPEIDEKPKERNDLHTKETRDELKQTTINQKFDDKIIHDTQATQKPEFMNESHKPIEIKESQSDDEENSCGGGDDDSGEFNYDSDAK